MASAVAAKRTARTGAVTDDASISDAELSRACRNGAPEAWRRLIRRCAPTAYRVALQMLRNQADADEACQEVFLRMYRGFDSYDSTRPLRPWVAKITYHVCVRRHENTARRATDLVAPEILAASSDAATIDPETLAAQSEAHVHLGAAMNELAASDRALLALRYREGLSDAEVAEVADMPVNTVKTRIFRARARLKARLAPILGSEES